MSQKRIHVPLSLVAHERLKKILLEANRDFTDGKVTPGDVISLALESAKLDVAALRLRATRAHLLLKRLLREGLGIDAVTAAEQLQIAANKLRLIGKVSVAKDEDLVHGKA